MHDGDRTTPADARGAEEDERGGGAVHGRGPRPRRGGRRDGGSPRERADRRPADDPCPRRRCRCSSSRSVGAAQADAAFEVYVPPEMREAMTAWGTLAPRISRPRRSRYRRLRSRNLIAGRSPAYRSTFATSGVRSWRARRRRPPCSIGGPRPGEHRHLRLHVRGPVLRGRGVVARSSGTSRIGRPSPSTSTITGSWSTRAGGGCTSTASRSRRRRDPVHVAQPGAPRPRRPRDPNLSDAGHGGVALRGRADAAGFFTPKEGRVGEDDQKIADFLDKWRESIRRRAFGWVLVGGAPSRSVQRRASACRGAAPRRPRIARAAGVDPEDLGVSTTSRTYQNSEQRRQDLLDFTLSAYMKAVEQRLSMADVTPRGYRAKFNLDSPPRRHEGPHGGLRDRRTSRPVPAGAWPARGHPERAQAEAAGATERSNGDNASDGRRLEVVD